MKRTLIGSTVLAAALFGGGIAIGEIAGIPGTSAASSVPAATTTGPTTAATAPDTSARPTFPAHGSAAHENAEKAVMGSAASQAQAAAVKSVGSGTAGAVTSNFQGDGYEVTVTKSDGSSAEVHLDSSFAVRADH
jgi:hypothetical protein